jgi:diguanylate cyclase (GGDEF)-like protein
MGEHHESTTWVVEPLRGTDLGDEPTLVMIAGPEIGTHLAVDRPSMTVGRDSECELSIQMPGVSRRHCEFQLKDGQVSVRDLGSTNGTWVNERRLDEGEIRTLEPGNLIHAGGVAYKLVGGGDLEHEYHEAVHAMMFLDGLTGARNRRYLMDLLSREIPRCIRHRRPLSILMLDVDHFKTINDEAGHLVGDDVLRGLVDRILEITRQEDSVTRYGGDEFVIVMPETEGEGATIFGERLRAVVEERGFESDEERIHATISIGVVTCTEETETAEKLLEAADRQLYASKRAGRNRVS